MHSLRCFSIKITPWIEVKWFDEACCYEISRNVLCQQKKWAPRNLISVDYFGLENGNNMVKIF